MSGSQSRRPTAGGRLPARALAPAKINLGLFVGPVRPDGRHELVSVMQSISLSDELTLERSGSPADTGERTSTRPAHPRTPRGTNPPDETLCPAAPQLSGAHNLAGRALSVFRGRTGWDPGPLRLTIDKRIPVAAGMGGGSGDAAAALRLAAHASGLGEPELLSALACELGADVPAQLLPGRWLAQGAGEQVQQLPSPDEPFGVLVLPLAQALSTASVYAEADRLGVGRTGDELSAYREWLLDALSGGRQLPPAELLENDLQSAAISLCPDIEVALAQARGVGADVALVSGSGPTVLGLFAGEDGVRRAREAAARLSGRDPRPLTAVPVERELARVVAVRNNEPVHPQA